MPSNDFAPGGQQARAARTSAGVGVCCGLGESGIVMMNLESLGLAGDTGGAGGLYAFIRRWPWS